MGQFLSHRKMELGLGDYSNAGLLVRIARKVGLQGEAIWVPAILSAGFRLSPSLAATLPEAPRITYRSL